LVRFADRAGKGLRTARDALVADSVNPRRRGLAFGLHRAGDTGGAVFGIGIALLVVRSVEAGGGAFDRGTFQRLVLLSMVPAFLAVIVLALGAREVRRASKAAGDAAPAKGRRLGREFLLFVGVMVVFTLGNSSDAFLILRAQDVGLSVTSVLGMMLTFNLVYAAVATPAGALSDRLGRKRLLLLGWTIYALTYLGFSMARVGWHAWLLMLAYGVYYGLTEGAAKAFVADLVPAEARGAAYGAFHAAIGLTALPASLAAGAVAGRRPLAGLGSLGALCVRRGHGVPGDPAVRSAAAAPAKAGRVT
jgi:MFS family permease